MPQIHPSALVDDAAVLADDVIVGPYCVIEGEVHIGAGTVLEHHVHLKGPLWMGEGNHIYCFVCLGADPNDRSFAPCRPGAGTRIGDRNTLRESVSIHRATGSDPTTIGSDNYLMGGVHLGHDVVMGSFCTIAHNASFAGHVQIGDQVTIGGMGGVQQFCRIGRLAILSGLAGVTQDIPPFCACYNTRYIASLNVIGLRRAGLRDQIEPLKKAYDLLFRSRLSNPNALQRIRTELGDSPLCLEFADFVATSRRGISPQQPQRIKFVGEEQQA